MFKYLFSFIFLLFISESFNSQECLPLGISGGTQSSKILYYDCESKVNIHGVGLAPFGIAHCSIEGSAELLTGNANLFYMPWEQMQVVFPGSVVWENELSNCSYTPGNGCDISIDSLWYEQTPEGFVFTALLGNWGEILTINGSLYYWFDDQYGNVSYSTSTFNDLDDISYFNSNSQVEVTFGPIQIENPTIFNLIIKTTSSNINYPCNENYEDVANNRFTLEIIPNNTSNVTLLNIDGTQAELIGPAIYYDLTGRRINDKARLAPGIYLVVENWSNGKITARKEFLIQ